MAGSSSPSDRTTSSMSRSAQPGNNVLHDDAHGQIRRINLDGSGAEVYARGVRNTVGFDWHPETKQLYFTDNGRDWLSEDVPEDELNRVTKVGEHFGAPFCLQGNIARPRIRLGQVLQRLHRAGRVCWARIRPRSACASTPAACSRQAYKNAIFIARHGSWNKSQKQGGDVVVVKLDKDGTVKSIEPFLTGFIEDNKYVGRPVDVMQLKDGSLLVSDDWNGAVYRITYGKQKVAAQ